MPITMTSGRVLWVVNRRRGKVLESVMLRGFQVRRWDPLMETAEEAKTPTNIDEAGCALLRDTGGIRSILLARALIDERIRI
jgi:hypothetical protein